MKNGILERLSHAFETPFSNPVLIFAIILFIILLSPVLLRKIRIPGIIGLIVSGVIIGPHGLNILAKNSAVDLFSTIGIIYIMFVAGLELDMNDFGKTRHKSLTFGFFTFATPMLVGFPVFHFLLDYDVAASTMISVMMATHTLVAFPVVTSYGISKNEAVAVAIGGTILTDTAVLVVLAIVVAFSEGVLSSQFWIQMGISFAGFFFIMFVIIPKISKWFFRQVEGEKTTHYIYILSIVFFSAFLAEIAGLEPIIGAFMAGLALNRLIPHSSALMNRIEFIGNAIFIPFFLISVGMIVDIGVLLSGPTAILIALTLIAVSISGKWSAAWITQKIFSYSPAKRQLIYGLSGSHAAATLAVILVGYQHEIVGENVLNGAIVLILVSCIIATFVAEAASKKVLLEEDQVTAQTDGKQNKAERILIPVANLNNMEILLDLATLVRNQKTVEPLTVLSVVPNNALAELNLKKARKNLDSIARYASGSETEVEIMTTIDYNIAGGISRASKEVSADCILLGWPSKVSIIDKLVGEKTESILNRTNTNIMMCSLPQPLVTQARIMVFAPPLSEAEKGFPYWMEKLNRLAQELSRPVCFVCNKRTEKYIQRLQENNKSRIPVSFVYYTNWDALEGLNQYIKAQDMIVFISARVGEVSYNASFDGIPRKLGRLYGEHNIILVYPSRRVGYYGDELVDVHTAPYAPGQEALFKLGRKVGNLFTKENKKNE